MFSKDRVRGWFPRNAAIEVDQFYNSEDQNEDKKDQ